MNEYSLLQQEIKELGDAYLAKRRWNHQLAISKLILDTAETGDVHQLEETFAACPDVSPGDFLHGEYYPYAFQNACKHSHKDYVVWLLKHACIVEHFRNTFQAELVRMCGVGNYSIVETLLSAIKAQPRTSPPRSRISVSFDSAVLAASGAGHEDIARLLLGHMTKIEAESVAFDPALIAASKGGHAQVAELLLKHIPKLDVETAPCHAALEAAKNGKHEQVINVLLKGSLLQATKAGDKSRLDRLLDHRAYVDALDTDMYAHALQAAIRGRHDKIVDRLLNMVHSLDLTHDVQAGVLVEPLHAASLAGDLRTVQQLLECGADSNARDNWGTTVLQTAVRAGHLDVARHLVIHGAEVNPDTGPYKGTPLQIAAACGDMYMTKLLLDSGALVNPPVRSEDESPLCAASRLKSEKVAALLIEWGADIKAPGGRDGTALDVACARGNLKIVDILLANLATELSVGDLKTAVRATARGGHQDIMNRLLVYRPALDIDAVTAARRGGHTDVVKLLSKFWNL